MVGTIHLKYWKNFLISRLFLSNFHELTSQWLQKKIQNFKEIIFIYIYIAFDARDLEILNMQLLLRNI